jgi:hypothetical protein
MASKPTRDTHKENRMIHEGTIKLVRVIGKNEKVVDRKVYTTIQERKEIIDRWVTDYDKMISNCCIQINPTLMQGEMRKFVPFFNIQKKKTYYEKFYE